MNRKFPLFYSIASSVMLIFVAMSQASGAILCVDTTADLFNDLQAYSDGGAHRGEDLVIHLVYGVYKVGSDTSNKPFTYSSTAPTGVLSIWGGWATNCAAQMPGVNLSVLDGAGKAQVLKIDNNIGAVSILQLIVQNGETTELGAGLAVNTVATSGGAVEIEDSIIRNNHTTTYAGGLAAYASGASNDLYVNNNLILNNSADLEYGAAYTDGDTMDAIQVVSNTVYGNTTSSGTVGGFVAGGRVSAAYKLYVASNIFAQNTATDLYMIGTAGDVEYNDYGSFDGVAPSFKLGNVSVTANFVDAANGDFRLSGASPLIGLTHGEGGCYTPYDLDGNIRNFYSSVCDPGAYAETIFSSSLEAQ